MLLQQFKQSSNIIKNRERNRREIILLRQFKYNTDIIRRNKERKIIQIKMKMKMQRINKT